MYFTDDAKMLGDLLSKEWDRGINSKPPINYKAESFLVSARTNSIYIDRLTRSNTIDSTDYSSVGRQSYLSVRVSTPANMRDVHFACCNEVVRIIEQNRRAGVHRLGGWEYMEIVSERPVQDASGTYVNVFDIKLTRFHQPIRHHGFGSDVCVEPLKEYIFNNDEWEDCELENEKTDIDPVVTDPGCCCCMENEQTEVDDAVTDPGTCDDTHNEQTDFGYDVTDPGDCANVNEMTEIEEEVTDPGDCSMPDMTFED